MENNKNESIYKLLLTIALPITIQSLFQALLTIVDQLMVGQLGENAIATIAISNKLFSIFLFIIFALTGGASIFIAQFWGKKDLNSIIKTIKIPIIVGGLVMIGFVAIVFLFPEKSIELFTRDKLVIEGAADIQRIYFISALPILFINIYATMLRGTCQVKLPMYTGLISIVTNTFLNYILIFGKLGCPALGAKGAAIATVIVRFLEFSILFVIIHRKNSAIKFNVFELIKSKIDDQFIKLFWKATWPLLTLNLVFILADTLYSRIYGLMSTKDMVAMSVIFPFQGFSIGLFGGISAATGIILGTKLGEKEFDLVIIYAKKILKIAAILTLIIAGILLAVSNLYLSLYNISPEVRKDCQKLSVVIAIFLVVKVLNMVIGQGILQSGGNTKYILFLDIIGMWMIGLPLAYISAFVLNWPIYMVYFVISFEEVVRLILGIRKVLAKDWAVNLVENLSA